MIQRLVYRYSIAFKQEVIERFESGQFVSIEEAREHYGIRGACTIQGWLRKYGRNHLCSKVVRVERPEEKDQIRALRQEIRRLKEALGQTQAEKILGDEFLRIACEKLGQEVEQFKKKVDTRRFTEPDEAAE